MTTQLDYLRSKSTVDCDTLDASVPQDIPGFVDCTSNQAIAYFEIQRDAHKDLIESSAKLAIKLSATYKDVPTPALTVEIMMVSLSLLITPHISGYVHTQTNPLYSYSTPKTVENARRIVALYKHIKSEFPSERVCIKIPSTWEGLQACKILEAEGISTLATTLFTIEQAAMAAEVNCRYIAPYVNVLRVHFEPGAVDENKAFGLCVQAQKYFKAHGYSRTETLPASLTSTAEVLKLAGAAHITVSPPLLRELASSAYSPDTTAASVYETTAADYIVPAEKILLSGDESAFRLALTRSGCGVNEGKLVEAINIFCGMQEKMEAIAKVALVKVAVTKP